MIGFSCTDRSTCRMFRAMRQAHPLTVLLVGLSAFWGIHGKLANAQLCPSGAAGSCTTAHLLPGCANLACCESVCMMDPSCCLNSWDQDCVAIALLGCTGIPAQCGAPGTGPCDTVHSTPSCIDATCCETVCSVFPYCCSVSWDQLCVTAAAGACPAFCTPQCPPQATQESEPCSLVGLGNAPCIGGTPNPNLISLVGGTALCGSLRFVADGQVGTADLDAYRVVIADPNGDGVGRLNLEIEAEFGTDGTVDAPIFAVLLAQPCDDFSQSVMTIQTTGCDPMQRTDFVPSGVWYVVVARGTFPTAAAFPYACPAVQSYNLRATMDDPCAEACGCPGDCFSPHPSAGCQIASCCESVCPIDPSCCSKACDQACADLAIIQCTPPVPSYDLCSQATTISLGSFPFTLAGATADPALVPAGCMTGLSSTGVDVWFKLQDVRGTLTLGTCAPGSLNTALMVYPYPCSGTSPAIACSDDFALCFDNPLSANLNFVAQCDTEYLVRVASVNGSVGNAFLNVMSEGEPCQPCPADINGDGHVDGVDLSTLLSGWGSSGGGDINGNGVVDGTDLTTLLSGWGTCP